MKRLVMLLAGAMIFAQTSLLAQPKLPRQAPPMNLLLPCKGRPTIVAFINTGCSHCKAFARDVLEPISERGEACAIAIAFNEDGDTARFAREQGLTFPVYKVERSVVRGFLGITGPEGIIGTPQVVVIDKHGMIQAQSKREGSPLLLQPEIIREITARLK